MDSQEFVAELSYIERQCQEYGIGIPSSFAYLAYDTDPLALEALKRKGYITARIGGKRMYRPHIDHPFLLPSFSTTGTDSASVMQAIRQEKYGGIVVLTIHGVPD